MKFALSQRWFYCLVCKTWVAVNGLKMTVNGGIQRPLSFGQGRRSPVREEGKDKWLRWRIDYPNQRGEWRLNEERLAELSKKHLLCDCFDVKAVNRNIVWKEVCVKNYTILLGCLFIVVFKPGFITHIKIYETLILMVIIFVCFSFLKCQHLNMQCAYVQCISVFSFQLRCWVGQSLQTQNAVVVIIKPNKTQVKGRV